MVVITADVYTFQIMFIYSIIISFLGARSDGDDVTRLDDISWCVAGWNITFIQFKNNSRHF